LPYPTDGVVIKIDGKATAASLGCTEHHPNGNIAYKFSAQKATTRVLRIEISVGKTGRRTPVAYLEPVMIMGRKVRKASLGSENKMAELGVTEGCLVEVGLSNDVTPKIYRVVEDNEKLKMKNEKLGPDCEDSEHRYDVITERRNATGQGGHQVLKAIGSVAAMTVVLVIIWQTGLLIPLGLIGLGMSGLIK